MAETRKTDSGILGAIAKGSPELQEFREAARRMLITRNIAEICSILVPSLKKLLKARRVGVFLHDPNTNAFAAVQGSAAELEPEKEVVDFALQEPKPPTIPHATGGFITVFAMRVQPQVVGYLSVDVTDIAEEMGKKDLEPVTALVDQAAVAFYNAQIVSRSQDESMLLSNILDSITNGILTVDTEKRITRMNRNTMAMLEISPDAVGRAYHEVLPPSLTESIDELIKETTEMGFAMEKMVALKLSQGLELNVAVATSILRDESFNTLGMIIVFRDMTASRELERLRRLDQMKSEFVANVSHELKTPLTSIKAYTEALQDMIEDEQAKSFLKVVDEESDRLLYLINDLLNVSRIQSGKMKMNFLLCDPKSVVNEVLSISRVQSAKHKVVLELAEGLPEILLDKERLKEVMINLMSNAIKYSPEGGNVWVRMRKDEGNLRIEVQDQGMGISKENQQKLFQAFYRVDSSLTAEIPGTGLGLVIVKAIVEHHGGKIWLESDLGKGTTFIILIPMRNEIRRGETGYDMAASMAE